MASLSPVLAFLPGGSEVWIIILAIVVLIWGPKQLPSLARSLGLAKKEFKKASEETDEPAKPAPADQKKPADAEKAGATGHGPN